MPLFRFENLYVVEPDYELANKYWPVVTQFVSEKYGSDELVDHEAIVQCLKDVFSFFCEGFKKKLAELPQASFFVFVNYIHDDSVEIWSRKLKGEEFPFNGEDFAGTRRIMKCILEQGCSLNLKGHPFFYKEICENFESYGRHLDELLYLGLKAFEYSEYIARSLLCPHSIRTKIDSGEFTVYIYPPFNTLFKFIFEDQERHKGKVAISNCVYELKSIFSEKLNVSFENFCGFVGHQLSQKRFKFGVFKVNDLVNDLCERFGYPKNILSELYKGLTVSRTNVLTFEDSLLKTQNENRFSFRPILEYNIDGESYFLCGANKWSESITMLTTNCFPFGQFPTEWGRIPELKNFFIDIQNNHDKILEDPASEILKEQKIKHDRNVKYLLKPNNRNISLLTKGVGEIDLFFLDEVRCAIYVVECKHNRARYEFHNWRRDIENFRRTYEKQLNNKVKWVSENLADVLEHFEMLFDCELRNKQSYTVIPMFLINAPSLYMYDSEFSVFTLHDLELYLKGKHVVYNFNGKIGQKEFTFGAPYLRNAERLFTDITNE